MMKIKLLLVFLIISSLSANAQSEFKLLGNFKGHDSGYIKMMYVEGGGASKQDSAKITNGKFQFTGKLDGPTVAYLIGPRAKMRASDPNLALVFIEPGNLLVELTQDDFANLKLSGSKSHGEYAQLELQKKVFTSQVKLLSAELDKLNDDYNQRKKDGKSENEIASLKAKVEEVKRKISPLSMQLDKLDMEYIKTHPNSFYSVYSLRSRIMSMPPETGRLLYEGLSDNLKQSSLGKEIDADIKRLAGGAPGSKAKVFAKQDINGQALSLADFKGKNYVLIDFWASWCIPCRKGNPHLLSLYAKYKDKGLEIIGVSDDDNNPSAWKKAVEQDKIGVWKHVLRGFAKNGSSNETSFDIHRAYGVTTLPTKILVDKNGLIIGRYGGGGEDESAIDKKLSEIFN